MGSFYLPYHFIPVSRGGRKGDLPVGELQRGADGKIEGVRHDRYAASTHSGTIQCTVEAASPIFVGHEKPEGKQEVQPFKLAGKPALPASSLRGLISSFAEAAGNSSLRVLSPRAQGQACYSYRKPMREPLTAIGMLFYEGDQWKLQPVCLPLLQFYKRRLRPEFNKWKNVFSAPVFRVFVGNYEDIRRHEDDPTNPAKRAWPYRTTSTAGGGVRVQQLTWAQVESLDSALHVKGSGDFDTVVAQKKEDKFPVRRCLIRVLGCYEKDGDGQPLRKIPEGKKHELFLPFDRQFPKLTVPRETMDAFQQLSDQMTFDSKAEETARPYEPKDTRPGRKPGDRLLPQAGDLVFFDIDDKSQVKEISYSSIWRGRVNTSDGKAANAWTFFEKVDPELTPFHHGRKQVTLAERIFGFVEEEKDGEEAKNGLRLKSRVRFSPGLADGEVTELGTIPLKELSSPKPPSPALYFRKPLGQNEYIPKSKLQPGTHWPQGRKVYLHDPGAIAGRTKRWQNSDANFVPDRHVKVNPWAKGSKWRFEVRFDNLNDLELGLLLYALSPSDSFLHKIGMGKPLGLGSIQIKIEHVLIVNRDERYTSGGWNKPRYGEGFDWREKRDHFRDGMIPELRAAIEALGDPAQLNERTEISYPRVITQRGEDKLYEWFVSNEKQKEPSRQVALQPVVKAVGKQIEVRIEPLPRLQPPRD